MPEDPDLDDEHADDSAVIKELRQRAGRADAAESKAADLERELVVHKAGLTTLTDKQLKALSAAHEGDWEPEALKATAVELGFGPQPNGTQEPEPKIPEAEAAAMQRVANASGGPPQPVLQGDDALKAALAEAWDSPEQMKAVLAQHGRLAQSE
jgi:hypothetical protein